MSWIRNYTTKVSPVESGATEITSEELGNMLQWSTQYGDQSNYKRN